MKVAELKLQLYVVTLHALDKDDTQEWNRGQVIEILTPTTCKASIRI